MQTVKAVLSEIGLLDLFVVAKVCRIPLGHHTPLGEHVTVVGDPEGLPYILFHQKDGHTLLPGCPE
jgi:hypothetical protein